MTQFVRHHAGDFALGLRRFDHSAVDEHRAARQCERVDFANVDDLEAIAEFGMAQVRPNRGRQTAAKLFHAYGLGNSLFLPFWAGATSILSDARSTPDRWPA